jgi:large subunit ribosomal protein L35
MAKFKLKSKRSTVKRLRSTGSGKVKMGRAGKRHLNTSKARGTKRGLRGTGILTKQDAKLVMATVPYGLPK